MHAFHRTIIATILMLALQLVALSSWAFAQVPFDVPGAVHTSVNGINDAGAVAGRYTDSAGTDHGFLWQGGSFTPLDVPGAVRTVASGVNDAGAVVGEYTDSAGTRHGFIIP
jgi:probable HAF family extracellular repeat protein